MSSFPVPRTKQIIWGDLRRTGSGRVQRDSSPAEVTHHYYLYELIRSPLWTCDCHPSTEI
jgi:hypothetical protein